MSTLAAPARHEALIKHSRFIALAERHASEAGMRQFLEQVHEAGANHHCWAWKSGQQYRFDDDGEPGGTAGRPILQAIEGQDLDQVGVVVIRYFGGVKLGTGGLARAYGGTAAECLRQASRERLVETTRLRICLGFEHVDRTHQLLAQFAAEKISERYGEQGLDLEIELPLTNLDALSVTLKDLTRGQVTLQQLDFA